MATVRLQPFLHMRLMKCKGLKRLCSLMTRQKCFLFKISHGKKQVPCRRGATSSTKLILYTAFYPPSQFPCLFRSLSRVTTVFRFGYSLGKKRNIRLAPSLLVLISRTAPPPPPSPSADTSLTTSPEKTITKIQKDINRIQ